MKGTPRWFTSGRLAHVLANNSLPLTSHLVTPCARATACFVLLAAFSPLAAAHHGSANYDRETVIVVEGVVAGVEWVNPHIELTLEVAGEQGESVLQRVEGGSISTLSPLGLTRDSLAVGERVTVRAFPDRRGPGRPVLGVDAAKGDGSVVPLNASAARARPPSVAVASSIAGRWLRPQQAFYDLGTAASAWPMTEKGRAVFTGRSAQTDCVAVGAPQLMLYPTLIDIALDEQSVAFTLDWMGVQRVVHLDATEHPANVQPSAQGHSIGRWEDGVLVVDTLGFAEHREGLGFGLPSGPGKHLVERFALDADDRHLNYEIMAEDPEYLTEPIYASAKWEYAPDIEPSNAECDLDSARRFLEEP